MVATAARAWPATTSSASSSTAAPLRQQSRHGPSLSARQFARQAQYTQTLEPIGMTLADQIQSITWFATRTQPWEAG